MGKTPTTTLFMLSSLDGKISTGIGDERDFDKDLPKVGKLSKGLKQYYKLEEETDVFSLNTGKVMSKVGWNDEKANIKQIPVTFIIIDNKPHLTELGVRNLLKRAKSLIIVTTNPEHPSRNIDNPNLEVLHYQGEVNFKGLFEQLKSQGIDKLTVQSGGEMNAVLFRASLIDYVSIVIAPVIVGGRDTPTLVDGESLKTLEDLHKLKELELLDATKLSDSYLHLRYKVSPK